VLCQLSYFGVNEARSMPKGLPPSQARGGAFLDPVAGKEYAFGQMKVLGSMFVVGAGGFLGSVLRYGLSLVGQRFSVTFPHGTLWANLLGCLVLGAVVALAAETEILSPSSRLFWATGLCGGFTTMSTFMYEMSRFAQDAEYAIATVYFAATLAGCAVAFFAGTLAVWWLMKG
jgi:fluoride exporter